MLISVHIPKTAGVTMRVLLARAYGRDVFFDYGSQYALTDPTEPTLGMRARRVVRALGSRRRLRPSDRCVHGHFPATRYAARFPDAPTIIWLRDPVDRVISHYEYWRRVPDPAHGICRRLVQERWSLEQFAEVPAMRNLQARYCDGRTIDSFAFVGLQERFDEMLPRMIAAAGIPPAPIPPAQNVGPGKAVLDSYPLEARIRDHIERLNLVDRALYEAARARTSHEGM